VSTSPERLTRAIRWLQAYAALLTIALVVLFFRSGTSADDVLRTRGLIIEDEAGRERILIGAPIPEAANRVRTDEARVREVWASRYEDGEAYMGYYQDYNHAANGIVILSEDGFDRVVLGDPAPDPNIGKRIAPSTGLVINDAEGFERTGYSVKVVDGTYRVGLGLDSNRGGEGLVLTLDDDGVAGVIVGEGDDRLYLGKLPAGLGWWGREEAFRGLLIARDVEIVHKLNGAGGS